MKAEIISVGTELLLGEITDTNASFLAGQLPSLGIDLYWISQVGDNQNRMVEVLSRAWKRSDLILVTGGLGPTEDDLTREAIAELLGEKPEIKPELERELREFFARRKIEMTPSNLKQAWLIPSAKAISNTRGTAPGWWVEKGERILVAMPGPPGEMQRMWQNEILPEIRRRFSRAVIFSKTFKTFGVPESTVGEMVSPLFSSANPTLGIYAKPDGIHLRLAAKAQNEAKAKELMAKNESIITSTLSQCIWGINDDTLESVVGKMLLEKGLSLAIMESCTGGLLAETITSVPESAIYFKGGIVACSDEAKIASGVDSRIMAQYGSNSPEVAKAMADAARLRLGADIGMGIVGAIEQDKIESKAAGVTHIAISDGKKVRMGKGNHPGDRTLIRRRAATAALFELKQFLM